MRRLPQRATDRVEDAVAWLLMVLALITVVGAAAAGVSGWSEAMDRVRAETAERALVRAVLVEASTTIGQHQVLATWTGPGGVAVSGPVPVRDRRPAGAEVRVWLDGDGRVTSAPMEPRAAVVVGWVRGVLAAMCGWSLLALAWMGVRRSVEVRNAVAWGREWERVEPTWSGRLRP